MLKTYCWLWLKTASTHSVGHIDLWIGLTAAVLGVVDHYWPDAQIMTTYAWQIPIWMLAGVMLIRLLLAPFWIWQEQNKAMVALTGENAALKAELEQAKISAEPNTRERVSFVEFRKLAESEFGWDFNSYSTQLLDFANGIRQAAVDGVLVLDGRLGCTDIPKSMKDQFPLQPIACRHFIEFDINAVLDDNYEIQTYRPGQSHTKEGRYRDLHLSDKDAATAWLRGVGKSWQSPQPDAELETVLNHIAHYSAIDSWTGAKREFENAAKNSEVSVWGREFSDPSWISSAYDKLTAEHWKHAGLDMTTFADTTSAADIVIVRDNDGNTVQRTTSDDVDRWPIFAYLRVNRGDVLKLWPITKLGSPLPP